mgnify:FL=1
MKCENVEFEYIAAPDELSIEAKTHIESCAVCQRMVDQQMHFNKKLTDVLNQPVPNNLRHSSREFVQRNKVINWSFPKASLALAASVLLAVGLVRVNLVNDASDFSVDRLVVEHFEHDGARSMKASHVIAPTQLTQLGHSFGVQVNLANAVSFAERCPIGDSYGLHMVYQFKGQPVTVIYMPDIQLTTTLPFHYSGLHGWVKPLEKGSIAVIADSDIDLPSEEYAENAVEWI